MDDSTNIKKFFAAYQNMSSFQTAWIMTKLNSIFMDDVTKAYGSYNGVEFNLEIPQHVKDMVETLNGLYPTAAKRFDIGPDQIVVDNDIKSIYPEDPNQAIDRRELITALHTQRKAYKAKMVKINDDDGNSHFVLIADNTNNTQS